MLLNQMLKEDKCEKWINFQSFSKNWVCEKFVKVMVRKVVWHIKSHLPWEIVV
jgi:hypothetical protein